MSKKIVTLALAMAFAASTASVSVAARYVSCEVKAVDGSKVTLDCGKDAGKFDAGDNVKIKEKKKRRAIEGC